MDNNVPLNLPLSNTDSTLQISQSTANQLHLKDLFRSFVAILIDSFLIWLIISFLPSYDFLISATILVIFISFLDFIIFLILALYGIGKYIISKKTGTKYKKLLSVSIFILISVIISKFIVNIISPDYIGRANLEINRVVIDKNIPSSDGEEIKKIAKTLSQNKGLRISFYDCKRNLLTPTPEANGSVKLPSIFEPKRSGKCQKGDILLEIRGGYYASPLGSERSFEYFLLRKINNEWKVIEDLGKTGFIS